MQVILKENVKKLGRRGDIVKVAPGFFRNLLFPTGKAEIATKSKLKLAEERKEKARAEMEKLLENAKEVIEKLNGMSLVVKRKTTDKGTLYAAISEMDVVDLIEEESKMKLDKDSIKMDHLKEVGDHVVKVEVGDAGVAEVKLKIESL